MCALPAVVVVGIQMYTRPQEIFACTIYVRAPVASYPGPSHPPKKGPGSHCLCMCEVIVRMYGTGPVNVSVNGLIVTWPGILRRQYTSVGS